MITFWSLVAILILLALVLVLRPLIFSVRTEAGDMQPGSNLYQERLAELERDRESGALSPAQYSAVKLELERSLLSETENRQAAADKVLTQPGAGSNRLTMATVILILPVLAVIIYLALGQPRIISGLAQLSAQNDAMAMGEDKHSESIELMVEKLAQRLQREPNDEEGWNMLARSYMALQRYSQAAGALEQLYRLTGDRPDVLVRYADALAMANNGSLSGKPEKLIQKALQLEPNNLVGLWLGGMAAFEHGEFQQALDHWHKVMPLLGNNPQARDEVAQLIAKAEESLGIVSEKPAAAAGKSITVKVDLAQALSDKADQEDTVFIFARALSGPPMPVAIVRKQVKDLPLEVTLDDSTAIMPTRKLSAFEQVEVGARISKTGNAMPQPGDLTTTEVQVEVGSGETLQLSINQEL